jgi:adhesin transport system outer membrane protein
MIVIAGLATVTLSDCPVFAQNNQEPPPPLANPRPVVDSPSLGKTKALEQQRPTESLTTPPEPYVAVPSPDIHAGQPLPNENISAPADERGIKRAALLRLLQGGDMVLLDPDPNGPPTVTEPLTMTEAVAFALKNNYGAQAAKAKTEGTRWELVGGVGQYLPRIDYAYQTGKQNSAPSSTHTVTADGTFAVVPQSSQPYSTRTLTLTQPVIDLSIISDILARSYTLDAVAADEVGSREKLALDTITSFYRLIQARLSIGFVNNYKSALDRLAQRMRDRVSGGGASGVELDRITGRSVSARSSELQARSEYQAASVEFRRLTGVSPIKLSLPESLMPSIPYNVEEVLTKALQGNPDYLAAQLRTDAAIATSSKAFSAFFPKLSLQVASSQTYNNGGISQEIPAAVAPSAVYPKTTEKTIMAVFTWTLNGGVDFGQGMANAAYTRQASAAATDTRMRLEESVRVGFNALNSANAQIEALGQAVQANTKVVGSFEEQYASGSRQLLDLLDAYERLYQSQTELSRLLISEATAGFVIRRQMGELVPAILSTDEN